MCFFNFIFRPSKFCISITVQLPFSSPESTYCNKPWETFFKEAGNSPEEIWFGVVCDVKLAFKSFQHFKFLRKCSWSISYYLTVQLQYVTFTTVVAWWCGGESTRLPPMWPGFDFQTWRHMWLEFVGSLLFSESFSPFVKNLHLIRFDLCSFQLTMSPNIVP